MIKRIRITWDDDVVAQSGVDDAEDCERYNEAMTEALEEHLKAKYQGADVEVVRIEMELPHSIDRRVEVETDGDDDPWKVEKEVEEEVDEFCERGNVKDVLREYDLNNPKDEELEDQELEDEE